MKFAPSPLRDIPEHTQKHYYTTEYGVFEELPTREEIVMVRDLARSLVIRQSTVRLSEDGKTV